MAKYEVVETDYAPVIRWDDDGIIRFIPVNDANSDYQRYLRWLENPDAEENGTIS